MLQESSPLAVLTMVDENCSPRAICPSPHPVPSSVKMTEACVALCNMNLRKHAHSPEMHLCVKIVILLEMTPDHSGRTWFNVLFHICFSALLRKLAYGVHPTEVAEEILRTVNRRKQEVFMANPIAKAAVYIRTFFPELFFAVVAAGVKEKQKIEDGK